MAVQAVVAVVALGASAYSSSKQRKEAKKGRQSQERAADAQQRQVEKQNKLNQKRANIDTQRARVRSIREARIRRGNIVAGAANSGATGSSAALGAVSSVGAQLNNEFSYGIAQREIAEQSGALNVETGATLSAENKIQGQAQERYNTWGAIGGVADSVFSSAGGYKTIFSQFGK